MNAYAKAIVALVGAVGTWGMTAASAGGINAAEWFGLLSGLSTALAVYVVPNRVHG